MVSVTINGESRANGEITERWINRSINPLKAQGLLVCVQVRINKNGINMGLSTPGCGNGRGGRSPNRGEKDIFDLWARRGLNDPRFTGGNLIAFLSQLGLR